MNKDKVYIETYGCQMNFSDTEIVASLLKAGGFEIIDAIDDADIILLNTCSVRDNAEKKIHQRLMHLKQYKKRKNKLVVGVIGCMAERMQEKLIEEEDIVKIVVGPDEYRLIPQLINQAIGGQKGIAVELSTVETYDDITPLRTEGISAFISIMRGCNNFCTYCIVPYTRGRERSRDFDTIINEVKDLAQQGIKEITLLGQNVNSYTANHNSSNMDFPELIALCAEAAPEIRFRFTTSHPKDISDKLIETIANHNNICNHIHLAMQSGSTRVLDLMKRKYTYEHFMGRIQKIKELIPDCALSTDIIAGFPGETIEDHKQTLQAVRDIRYDGAFMFKYSPREGTKSYEMDDDVDEKEKLRRLNQIIEMQNNIALELNEAVIGKTQEVLVEGSSKRSRDDMMGRTGTNKVVVFPNNPPCKIGDLVEVQIVRSTSATLIGKRI